MDNEATLIIKGYTVHKAALESNDEKEQMYQEDRSPKQSEITPETSFHAGVSTM